MSAQKIIDALQDAQAGNFSRVTIEGATWVRLEDGLVIVPDDAMDKAHAVGFRDGVMAARAAMMPSKGTT